MSDVPPSDFEIDPEPTPPPSLPRRAIPGSVSAILGQFPHLSPIISPRERNEKRDVRTPSGDTPHGQRACLEEEPLSDGFSNLSVSGATKRPSYVSIAGKSFRTFSPLRGPSGKPSYASAAGKGFSPLRGLSGLTNWEKSTPSNDGARGETTPPIKEPPIKEDTNQEKSTPSNNGARGEIVTAPSVAECQELSSDDESKNSLPITQEPEQEEVEPIINDGDLQEDTDPPVEDTVPSNDDGAPALAVPPIEDIIVAVNLQRRILLDENRKPSADTVLKIVSAFEALAAMDLDLFVLNRTKVGRTTSLFTSHKNERVMAAAKNMLELCIAIRQSAESTIIAPVDQVVERENALVDLVDSSDDEDEVDDRKPAALPNRDMKENTLVDLVDSSDDEEEDEVDDRKPAALPSRDMKGDRRTLWQRYRHATSLRELPPDIANYKDRPIDYFSTFAQNHPKWKAAAAGVPDGANAIPPTSYASNPAYLTTILQGNFGPNERSRIVNEGALCLGEDGLPREKSWKVVYKLKEDLAVKLHRMNREVARALTVATTGITNRLASDGPWNWHSNRESRPSYEAEADRTDSMMKAFNSDLVAHFLGDGGLVIVFGKPSFEACVQGKALEGSWYKLNQLIQRYQQMPHMCTVANGWMTTLLRDVLLDVFAENIARDLGVEPIYIPDNEKDGWFRPTSPPRRCTDGTTFVPFWHRNFFDEMILITNDPMDEEGYEDYADEIRGLYGNNLEAFGSRSSVSAAARSGQLGVCARWYCTGCNLPGYVRFGARCTDENGEVCGKFEMCDNGQGQMVQFIVPGYCANANCHTRGALNRQHICADGTRPRLTQMTPSVDFNPALSSGRNIMVQEFREGCLVKSYASIGGGESLSEAASSVAHGKAERLIREGRTGEVPSWMKKRDGALISATSSSVKERMRDIIIGRNGLEDGEFQVGDTTFRGIPIELPANHHTGSLPGPTRGAKTWGQAIWNEYFG